MYIPDQYRNDDTEEVTEFLRHNGFAILVNAVDGRPWATHLPLVFERTADGRGILHGHMSKENPQWKQFEENPDVMAIFNGPHAYISSSWYDHENVPTWNYIAVHVYGTVRILDEAGAIGSLKKLTDKYEAGNENPVRIEDLSAKTMRQARGIVAFEIDIERIDAKRKMSQNRDAGNYAAIVDRLASGIPEERAVSEEMKRKTPFS